MQLTATARILRLPSVKARTGLSRSTIYQRIAEGSFPRQVSLGPRAIGWLESDVDAWIGSLLREHRSPFSAASENESDLSVAISTCSLEPERARTCRFCRSERSRQSRNLA